MKSVDSRLLALHQLSSSNIIVPRRWPDGGMESCFFTSFFFFSPFVGETVELRYFFGNEMSYGAQAQYLRKHFAYPAMIFLS